jgi:hypothetical protein
MAKIKFDVSDVEPGMDFDTPVPVGVYKMRITDIEETTSSKDGKDMLKIELTIINGEYKGRKVWDYIKYSDENSAWKWMQFLEAVGLVKGKKKTGTFDTAKVEGTVIVVKTKIEKSEEYGESSKVASMQPLPAEQAEEEDEDPEAEEEETEPEDDDAEGGDEDEEEWTVADVRAMDLDELKETIDDYELDIKVTKKSKAKTIQDKIIEEWGLEEEAEEDEDEEELDYSEMSVAELKATLEERGLSTKGKKAGLIKRLEKDDAKESGGSESDPF